MISYKVRVQSLTQTYLAHIHTRLDGKSEKRLCLSMFVYPRWDRGTEKQMEPSAFVFITPIMLPLLLLTPNSHHPQLLV